MNQIKQNNCDKYIYNYINIFEEKKTEKSNEHLAIKKKKVHTANQLQLNAQLS